MLRLLTLLFVLAMSAHAQTAEYPNPLVMQRADPWVYQHSDGYYYLVATVPQYDRIELRRSRAIEGLGAAEPVTIWSRHANGPMSHHIWAPELHFLDGKWYVYFAAGQAEAIWKIRMYALESAAANPLDGDWEEKGQIATAWDDFSLDATVFELRGERYYVWAQHDPAIGGNTNLYISKMDTPWSLTGKQTMIATPQYEWEKQRYNVNEGPAVLIRNGRILIAYSASATDHNYCLGLIWADENADLLAADSWTKGDQPIFASSEANGIFGPGHNSFTKGPNGEDLVVYHARNFKEIKGDPLRDWNRHTRVQPFGWSAEGFPILGEPMAESLPLIADKPLYRDPKYDGAADPVVIWNGHRGRWWMFYTNRRANADGLSGVAWVHGTGIGIAESSDGGATWTPAGEANIELPTELGIDEPTFWAPEVITAPDGTHHMYLTLVPGVFENWSHPRSIAHFVSQDLRSWRYESTLQLASDRVIDACVARLADGSWRMWYNNERDAKSIYFADSPDLRSWTDRGKAVGDRAGEGPKVVSWKGHYWMVTDVWDGLGVYRSDDAAAWTRQPGENLLQQPGLGADDQVKGGHADIVVQGERAYLFYFTHPGRVAGAEEDSYQTRRSSIQVVELSCHDGKLSADRDAPTPIKLDPAK